MQALRPAVTSYRLTAGLAIAVLGGLAIGYMDSRPGWDDTGITVVSLLLVGGVGALIAGRLPLLVAIAAGIWVPLLELPSIASGGPLAALVFAGIGAAIGWFVGRQ